MNFELAYRRVSGVAVGANVIRALTRIEVGESDKPKPVPLILAPFLNLGEEEAKKTVNEWFSRLLAEIRKVRDEQIAARKLDNALDTD